MPSEQVLEEKTGEVEAIKGILNEYKSIGIASLQKVRQRGSRKNRESPRAI